MAKTQDKKRIKEKVWEYSLSHEAICREADDVDVALYDKLGVKRGLRDINGKGVLTGLTNISKIISSTEIDGKSVPCDGQLWYRGYNVIDLVKDFGFKRFGFEEVAYLLIFGDLPTHYQLEEFKSILGSLRTLPTNFTRDVIMKAPSKDIMNSMTKSVLTLAAYDSNASDNSIPNVIRQCLSLVSEFPMLAVYGYNAYNHYECE
ncbi:MAG: citrate synthase, partial [Lachnospiraceae bacterium]|nr:citrate synthase [Lachnospiraceae bacterium]